MWMLKWMLMRMVGVVGVRYWDGFVSVYAEDGTSGVGGEDGADVGNAGDVLTIPGLEEGGARLARPKSRVRPLLGEGEGEGGRSPGLWREMVKVTWQREGREREMQNWVGVVRSE